MMFINQKIHKEEYLTFVFFAPLRWNRITNKSVVLYTPRILL